MMELLAPAGNMDALHAAISAGADAVYLGCVTYSARAFAGNFSNEELKEALAYAHLRGVKIYVTMNTLLLEEEIEPAMKQVDFLYQAGVDALLVQDLGLFHRLRIEYPDFEVHCSTQMHIHNAAGCKFMKQEGASRVVLARETPMEVVQECVKTGIEIEVFTYGALCISYSGQCLLSASVKNRSGNKGMCAQLCRLRYYPYGNHHKQPNRDGDFLLSPKDLNTIEEIPHLYKAGVASLKIEGRMKRPEYVYLVTSIYRKAIDACIQNREFILSDKEQEDLLLMFNRGFTKGHLMHATIAERMSHYRPNHQGIEIGRVLSYNPSNTLVKVKLSKPLAQHDGLRILNTPIDTGLTAVRIYSNGLLVNQAKAGDIVELECKSKPAPKPGLPLQKTSDSILLEKINRAMKEEHRLVPVTLEYHFEIGKPFMVTVTDGIHVVHTTSLCAVEQAKKAPLTKERLQEALSKVHDYPFAVTVKTGFYEEGFLPVSFLNDTRRRAMEAFKETRIQPAVRKGKKPYTFSLSKIPPSAISVLTVGGSNLKKDGILDITDAITPVVDENLSDDSLYENVVLSTIGNLYSKCINCYFGMNMNLSNSYAVAYLLGKEGIFGGCVSSEVGKESFERLKDAFKKRYGFEPNLYRFVYGRRTAMYIKDGFMEAMPEEMIDMEGRIYPLLKNNNGIITVKEPTIQADSVSKGEKVYMIFFDETKEEKEKKENEVYEEILGRI